MRAVCLVCESWDHVSRSINPEVLLHLHHVFSSQEGPNYPPPPPPLSMCFKSTGVGYCDLRSVKSPQRHAWALIKCIFWVIIRSTCRQPAPLPTPKSIFEPLLEDFLSPFLPSLSASAVISSAAPRDRVHLSHRWLLLIINAENNGFHQRSLAAGARLRGASSPSKNARRRGAAD